METYKFTKLNNSNILLQKIIVDDENYTIINKKNGDKLLKKITHIDIVNIENISNYNFSKSSISECFINNREFDKLKYKSILNQIYELINNGTKIIKNTTLNVVTIKKENNGFYYLENIGISVQGVDSNKCMFEIATQCVANNIKLSMKIKLKDETVINVNF